jgi:hypothetical protein
MREDHRHEEDDEAGLVEDRAELPCGPRRQEPEEDRRSVQGRDRDEVEDRQGDI